jgi:ribose 5-phosphate isomerase B
MLGVLRKNITLLKVTSPSLFLRHFNFTVNMSSIAKDEKQISSSNVNSVLIGSDHGGYEMKEQLKNYLKSCEIDFEDVGTYSTDSCDYPDIAHTLCNKLVSNNNGDDKTRRGILVCGTGIGISIAANKVPGIRCALCHDHYTVSMSRKHNDANVLALGGRTTGIEIAKEMVDVFLTEKHDGGRHSRRVNKIEK